ncbi:MAG: class I SAM-dependent methyltransferase [Promethearchaeia archaeon]
MREEKKFNKYKILGPDYHYQQINKKNRGTFNSFLYARYKILIDLIIQELKKLQKENQLIKILDLGCGDGVLFYLLSRKINSNVQLFGIDSSEEAINIAKTKNPNVTFYISNVYSLPFENDYFDMVISSDLIEHLAKPIIMLKEIKRVAKKDGVYIISTPIRFTENLLDPLHSHEFFQKEFLHLLKKEFKSVKIIQSHELLYYLLYNKKSKIFSKEIFIYRYLINLFSIYLNKNPFLKIKKKGDSSFFIYMYAIGKI